MQAVRRFLSSSFGSAILGGLVVAICGLILIEAGVIDAGDESSQSLVPGPLTKPASDSGEKGQTVNQIYDRYADGVAFIQAEVRQTTQSPFDLLPEEQRATASGSGFLIDGDGHVLTNAHVVEGAQQVQVQLGEDGEPQDAEVIGADPSSDLALLEVDDTKDSTPLPFGESEKADVGDPVVAIGNPFGLDRTVTTGIVSALQRQIEAPNGFAISDVIQTDAAINPGNSGGALLDQNGQVIGINSQIATAGGGGSVGVGFAVPIDTARDVANQLLDSGEVEHAFLGISAADLTPEIADVVNLERDSGALVQSVEPGSPADEAGIEAGDQEVAVGGQQLLAGGDVITAVDGEPVTAMEDVIAAVNTKQAGDEVTLAVQRGDETRDVTVELGERPQHAQG